MGVATDDELFKEFEIGYFLCSLRSLLHSINNKSCDKEERNPNKSYPQGMLREFIRNKVSYYSKTHYKLAYIIAILGEVVYLLFVHGKETVG